MTGRGGMTARAIAGLPDLLAAAAVVLFGLQGRLMAGAILGPEIVQQVEALRAAVARCRGQPREGGRREA